MPNVKAAKEAYKCNICGNVVAVLHVGGGELVCCGQPMELLSLKTHDEGEEKHVPIIEKNESGYKVKVGAVPHPMEGEHFIEWVVLLADDQVYMRDLKPGEPAEADFKVKAERVEARAFCNVHGLWTSG